MRLRPSLYWAPEAPSAFQRCSARNKELPISFFCMDSLIMSLLPGHHRSVLLRYAVSAGMVLIAFALRYAFPPSLSPYLLFIPAVFLASLLFNKGSGFVATAASAALALYAAPPVERTSGAFVAAMCLFVAICLLIAGATEALRGIVHRLGEAEEAQGLLLQEMGHRIKNDLAMVVSVLHLQARDVTEPDAKRAIETAIARVNVIAKAQDRLKHRADQRFATVDLAAYLDELCNELASVLRDVRPIALKVRCAHFDVSTSTAVNLGLIVNELVTNAIKYAFPGDEGGTVRVDVSSEGEFLHIVVSDDGVGCPDGVEGLGSKLIRMFAKRMDGEVTREPGEPGCRVKVSVKLD
ncbi:putative Sensor protein [Mesorhizobium plurifarium]|uniref:histidine kinase n=1 Tax=Mesorhizobium plurifarium TaxID=69974 RepID=A0A090G9U4_MESPL|nr:putative Sensor protein [Mesorhizobium plurifarium]